MTVSLALCREQPLHGRGGQVAGEADFELCLLKTERDRGVGEVVGDREVPNVRSLSVLDDVERHARAVPEGKAPGQGERLCAGEPDANLPKGDRRRRKEFDGERRLLPDPTDGLRPGLAVHHRFELPRAPPEAAEDAGDPEGRVSRPRLEPRHADRFIIDPETPGFRLEGPGEQ